MKIEIRSPIKIEKAPPLEGLLKTVQIETAKGLKHQIPIWRRMKKKVHDGMVELAKGLEDE